MHVSERGRRRATTVTTVRTTATTTMAASSSSSASSAAAVAEDDVRVGWPSQRPRAEPKMHGWFYDTHRRVFEHAFQREVKVILELGR